MAFRPSINVEETGDAISVCFANSKVLNEQAVEAIRDELFALADKVGKSRLRLKFNDVEFVCSSFLGMLITLQRKVSDAGGHLSIANATPDIVQVFELTGLTRLLDIEKK